MANEHIGRMGVVGFGPETTAGTSVAPAIYVRLLKNGFKRQAAIINNPSAMGRMEQVNSSATSKVWAEGAIEFKMDDLSIGYPLLGILGQVTTTDNPDSNPIVKDHTFSLVQGGVPSYMTVGVINPVVKRRHSMSVFDVVKFAWQPEEWVTVTTDLKGQSGATSSDVAAFTPVNEFLFQNVETRLGSTLTGIDSQPVLEVLRGELTLDKKSKQNWGAGSQSGEASSADHGPLVVTGEFVVRYGSTEHEDNWLNNVTKAMQVKFVLPGVTIGAAANPSLTINMPKATFKEFSNSDDLDSTVESTVTFQAELDTTAGYAVQAVLTNTWQSYA